LRCYRLPFANKIGIQYAWLTLALIMALTSIGPVVLIFKGQQWRARLGQPQFHKDI
jgi:hypothetical protein